MKRKSRYIPLPQHQSSPFKTEDHKQCLLSIRLLLSAYFEIANGFWVEHRVTEFVTAARSVRGRRCRTRETYEVLSFQVKIAELPSDSPVSIGYRQERVSRLLRQLVSQRGNKDGGWERRERGWELGGSEWRLGTEEAGLGTREVGRFSKTMGHFNILYGKVIFSKFTWVKSIVF